jgi:septal ring factor EnvC (AmiA/AmiB activator)
MRCRVAVCLAWVALGGWLAAQAPDSTATEAEARRIADRLRALQDESDRLASDAREALAELRTLEAERAAQLNRVRQARAAIAEGQQAVDQVAQRLLALESERAARLPALEAQLVDVYKRGRPGYARLVLGATGVREFARAARSVASMLEASRARVTAHRATVAAVVAQRAELEKELEARRALEADARRAQTAADRAVAAASAVIAKLDAQRDANARTAGELQLEQERLEQQAAAAASAAAGRPAPAATSPASPLTPLKGSLLWPVSGRITGRFGRRPASAEDSLAANGIEITSREGNPVRALYAGTVSFAGAFTGLGNMVIVDHGSGTQSVYGYLGSITVRREQAVTDGTEVGRVGVTPSGAPAVYLEVRIDGRSVDPVQWLRPQ